MYHLPGPTILQNRRESPSHEEFHRKNQLAQYSALQQNSVCKSTRVRLGEAHLCLGELLHLGEDYLRLGELLHLGKAYLPLGEVESIFKTASSSPRRTYLRLGEAEPTITRQLHKRKSILSLITLFYMKIYT